MQEMTRSAGAALTSRVTALDVEIFSQKRVGLDLLAVRRRSIQRRRRIDDHVDPFGWMKKRSRLC
jgi:hypothetical protein